MTFEHVPPLSFATFVESCESCKNVSHGRLTWNALPCFCGLRNFDKITMFFWSQTVPKIPYFAQKESQKELEGSCFCDFSCLTCLIHVFNFFLCKTQKFLTALRKNFPTSFEDKGRERTTKPRPVLCVFNSKIHTRPSYKTLKNFSCGNPTSAKDQSLRQHNRISVSLDRFFACDDFHTFVVFAWEASRKFWRNSRTLQEETTKSLKGSLVSFWLFFCPSVVFLTQVLKNPFCLGKV